VRKDRLRKDCCLQFYGSFRYNHKGSCYIYYKETEAEKQDAEEKLQEENAARKEQSNTAQILAKGALTEMNEHEKNIRYNTRTRTKQHVKKHGYVRGNRARGGIDGYRHYEGALKTIVPWINDLESQGIECNLLQDGAPAHKSRIARDYLTVEHVAWLWWPGHSPDVNASEHAWPWIRCHVTCDHKPSCNTKECEQQWQEEWDSMPIEVINKWVMGVQRVVRRIIQHGGRNDFHR
jgi:hypothetical protein